MAATYESIRTPNPRESQADDVWARIARSYAEFRSPFVPCFEDVSEYERAVNSQANRFGMRPLRAVMLGVTPGLALMSWPSGTRVVAFEISSAVIEALWPGDLTETRRAICASWLSMPMGQKSCDVVVGDGVLSTLKFPSEVRRLLGSVKSLLDNDGLFVARCYVQGNSREAIDDVFDALFSVPGISVDCFKMRLYLAMQRSTSEGVAVRDAAKILRRHSLSPRVMQDRLGWSKAQIDPFYAWPESSAVYSFPTLGELRAAFEEDFREVSVTFPLYELGRCCPILVMRSK